MLPQGILAKAAVLLGGFGFGAELLPRILNDGFGAIALTAGGLAGLGWLARNAHRGYRHGRAFAARVHDGVDTIQTVSERLDAIETRLETGEDRFDRIEKSLDVIASADRERVTNALAGDDRKAVDRRHAA